MLFHLYQGERLLLVPRYQQYKRSLNAWWMDSSSLYQDSKDEWIELLPFPFLTETSPLKSFYSGTFLLMLKVVLWHQKGQVVLYQDFKDERIELLSFPFPTEILLFRYVPVILKTNEIFISSLCLFGKIQLSNGLLYIRHTLSYFLSNKVYSRKLQIQSVDAKSIFFLLFR